MSDGLPHPAPSRTLGPRGWWALAVLCLAGAGAYWFIGSSLPSLVTGDIPPVVPPIAASPGSLPAPVPAAPGSDPFSLERNYLGTKYSADPHVGETWLIGLSPLRASASIYAPVIKILVAGTLSRIDTREGDWIRITTKQPGENPSTGFVLQNFAYMKQPTPAAPIVHARETENAPGITGLGSLLTDREEAREADPEAPPISEEDAEALEAKYLQQTYRHSPNVGETWIVGPGPMRSAPDVGASVVQLLTPGTRAQITERSGKWIKISIAQMDGHPLEGYVVQNFVIRPL